MKKHKSPKLSESQVELIETLGEKGMPDIEIAKQMNISFNQVGYITTRLWERKMKTAYEV